MDAAALTAALTAARDDFIRKARAVSPSCTLPSPSVEIMVVTPSYGNDDAGANAVQTEAWWLLSPREKGFMRQLAGPAPDDAGAKRVFETGAHRWVFIHELGHCWQACTGAKAHRTRYQLEYDANRIAAAYWHERDPEIVQYLQRIFRSVAASPSPVPAGQTAADYFNENYDQLVS